MKARLPLSFEDPMEQILHEMRRAILENEDCVFPRATLEDWLELFKQHMQRKKT